MVDGASAHLNEEFRLQHVMCCDPSPPPPPPPQQAPQADGHERPLRAHSKHAKREDQKPWSWDPILFLVSIYITESHMTCQSHYAHVDSD